MTSVSGGTAWGFGDLKMAPAARTCLDFHAMAAFEGGAELANGTRL